MKKSKLFRLYILYFISFILFIAVILIDINKYATLYKYIFNFSVIFFIATWYITMKAVRKENKKLMGKLRNKSEK